jgi:hypothetical protein
LYIHTLLTGGSLAAGLRDSPAGSQASKGQTLERLELAALDGIVV